MFLMAYFLSGGLDSSIISGITKKFAKHRIEESSKKGALFPSLHSFCCRS
ncbi:asparagine synthase-related protein [Areca yellow leaf disease phytoplasma]